MQRSFGAKLTYVLRVEIVPNAPGNSADVTIEPL
jgi:hypothetical protein